MTMMWGTMMMASAITLALAAVPAAAQQHASGGGACAGGAPAMQHGAHAGHANHAAHAGHGSHAHGAAPADSGFAALQQRGKAAMGVDQYTSTHCFDALADGGRIELQRDSDDPAGVATIRAH